MAARRSFILPGSVFGIAALAAFGCNSSKLVAGATCQNPGSSAIQDGGDQVAAPSSAPVRPVVTPFASHLTPEQAATAGATAADILTAMGADPSTMSNVTLTGDPRQFAVFTGGLGSVTPTEGTSIGWMATGVAGATTASSTDTSATSTQPGTDFTGAACGSNTHDCATLSFSFVVPDGLHSVAFDFNFMSTEYPEFVNAGYNDTFLVSMSSPSHNFANIVYDHNNNPINIDSVLFNEPCQQLAGTGFDLGASVNFCDAGGTGLLTTTAPVEPGETVTLTFKIYDSGDGIYDSAVMLDNLRVSPEPVGTPNTNTPTPTPVSSPAPTPTPCQ